MKEQLELIRQKCIEANPDIETDACLKCGAEQQMVRYCGECGENEEINIRLADVLLAIEEKRKKGGAENLSNWYAVNTNGIFLENKVKEITAQIYAHPMVSTLHSWNLYADDITKQSEETINFLYDLLK